MVSSFWCLSSQLLLLLFRFSPIVKKCSLDLNKGRKLHCFVWSFERLKSSESTSGKVAVACLSEYQKTRTFFQLSHFPTFPYMLN
jgi:hypothetical protein